MGTLDLDVFLDVQVLFNYIHYLRFSNLPALTFFFYNAIKTQDNAIKTQLQKNKLYDR